MPDLERAVSSKPENLIAPAGTYQMLRSVEHGVLGGGNSLGYVTIGEAMGLSRTLSVHVRRRVDGVNIFPHLDFEFLINESEAISEMEAKLVKVVKPNHNLREEPSVLFSQALGAIKETKRLQR